MVFTDLVGSTALAERLDPEVARAVLSRFYDLARGALERHGGTVEKFIGDAAMAIFGIPDVHEDDALRASRAAIELRDGLEHLDSELGKHFGVELRVRTGIATGAVVAGDPAAGTTLATGDALNVAARLQQTAGAGEILVSGATARLLRGSAVLDRLGPIAVKGRAEPVDVHRLLGLSGVPVMAMDGPFVGRARESDALLAQYTAVVEDRAPRLVTLVGLPGAGKSRLLREVLARLPVEATVLTGHCLSYGQGITYWPVAEMVRGAAAIAEADDPREARQKLDALLGHGQDGGTVAARIAAVIGLDPAGAVPEETPWAIRRLIEILAARGPLVVVVDDLHWAEPALLDVLEYVVGWSQDIPLLVICVARPEFRERRPDWAASIAASSVVSLGALDAEAIGDLVDSVAGHPLPAAVRGRIVGASDGNPLFAEELLGMLLEEGHVRWHDDGWSVIADLHRLTIPPTIGALLAERLGRLPASERDALERSSVVGERFDRGAILELTEPERRPEVPARLMALVRRELLRPDRSDLLGGDAFRFRHILVRDAAYEGLAKSTRSTLHERFAAWLERVAGDRIGEIEAVVGHHLAEAHRYRAELDPGDPRLADLAERAATLLLSAGRRSLDLGDVGAAVTSLERAHALLPSGAPLRVDSENELAGALFESGRTQAALELLRSVVREFEVVGDERRLLRASIMLETLSQRVASGRPFEASLRKLEEFGRRAEELGEVISQAEVWYGIAMWYWGALLVRPAVEARRQAQEQAMSAGLGRAWRRTLFWGAAYYGPDPVPAAGVAVERELRDAAGDRQRGMAAQVDLAGLRAMQGDIGAARALLREVSDTARELGMAIISAAMIEFEAYAETAAGYPNEAERILREGMPGLRALDLFYADTQADTLAVLVARSGRTDEAQACLGHPTTGFTVESADSHEEYHAHALALIASHRGDHRQAVLLATQAAALWEASDVIAMKAEIQLDAATIHLRAGDPVAAQAAAERSLALYQQKGHLPGASRARAFLDALALVDEAAPA